MIFGDFIKDVDVERLDDLIEVGFCLIVGVAVLASSCYLVFYG